MLVPRVIAAAGEQAARRFLKFFAATIRNKNTQQAYYRATVRFFEWCDTHKIGEIADIEPLHVAAYVEALGKDFEKPTVKQHLAAIRMLFDRLVTGQVVATNPAHAVRGPEACRQDRQDHGAHRRTGPRAAGQHRHVNPGRHA